MNSMVLVFAAVLAVAQGGVLTHNSVLEEARTSHLQKSSASSTVIANYGRGIVGHPPGTAIDYSDAVVSHHAAYESSAIVTNTAPIVAQNGVRYFAAPVVVAQHRNSAYTGQHRRAHAYDHGSGIERQWVSDYTEKIDDDGSYKGQYYY